MLMVMMTVEKMYLFALESIELLRTCAVNSFYFFFVQILTVPHEKLFDGFYHINKQP